MSPSTCSLFPERTPLLCQRHAVAEISQGTCVQECRIALEEALRRGSAEATDPQNFWRNAHDGLIEKLEDSPLRDALIEEVESIRLGLLTAGDPVCQRLSLKSHRAAILDFSYTDAQRALKNTAKLCFDSGNYHQGIQCIARLLSCGQHLIADIGTMGAAMNGAHQTNRHPEALRLAIHCAQIEETYTSLGIAAQSAAQLRLDGIALRYAERLLEKRFEKPTLQLAAQAARRLKKWKTAFLLINQGLSYKDNSRGYQKLMIEMLLHSGWVPEPGLARQLSRIDLTNIVNGLRSGINESGINPNLLLVISILYRTLGREEEANRFQKRHERRFAAVSL
ncbi:hypothetical protein HZA43_01695 [Candidatus Peregrinibacteria bacterium]|nr:hypothetical protein [Candidatus Peregrinibacteria bacterium]